MQNYLVSKELNNGIRLSSMKSFFNYSVLSKEKYAPPPYQPQIELTSMLTKIITSSLLCHNDTKYKEWLKSINSLKGGHALTQSSEKADFYGF